MAITVGLFFAPKVSAMSNAAQIGTLPAATNKQPKVINLSHPVSISDTLSALKESGNPMQEIGLTGNNVLGGFMPNTKKSISSQVSWVESSFSRRYRMMPAVSSITVLPNTSDATIKSLKNKLDKASIVELQNAIPNKPDNNSFARNNVKSEKLGLMSAQDIPDYFPTTFWGEAYEIPGGTKGYSYWINYLDVWGFDSDISALPDDWGLEYGFTSYNSTITGITRPLCGLGANTRFWSSTYSEGHLWSTYNVPAAAAPYADYNILSDSCTANSIEVGLGYPKEVPMNSDINFTVELQDGEESSSPASATVTLISNDCNDLNIWPGTNCMGLNTDREVPEGYEKFQTYVNIHREWTIPSCMAMQDGMDEPYLGCD